MVYDTIILGAGASGLMAASHLVHKHILLIDSQSKVARKLAISGGGRCNITNEVVDSSHYLGDKTFVSSVLERFSQHDLLRYLQEHDLALVVEKNRQIFCANSAKDLIGLLMRNITPSMLKLDTLIKRVEKNEDIFRVHTSRGLFQAHSVIVATGSSSYNKIGASDIGLGIAQNFGHEVRPFESALVGLTVQPKQMWMCSLSGVSLPVRITVGKRYFTGDMLFTHKGISGPVVLSASLFYRRGAITVDFLPNYKLKQLFKPSNKHITTVLPLQKRLSSALLDAIGVEDKPTNALTPTDKERLSYIKSYAFSPAGNFGLNKAEAAKGGVLTDCIDANSMQSTLVQGLYFTGEVLDVTGVLGGYNIQWALSTATVAAGALGS